MHNENMESAGSGDDDSEREAVIAADDTGMVRQQEILIHSELEDSTEGDVERGAGPL